MYRNFSANKIQNGIFLTFFDKWIFYSFITFFLGRFEPKSYLFRRLFAVDYSFSENCSARYVIGTIEFRGKKINEIIISGMQTIRYIERIVLFDSRQNYRFPNCYLLFHPRIQVKKSGSRWRQRRQNVKIYLVIFLKN